MDPATPPRELELLDTTLREGEQTPGVVIDHQDKLDIARQLDAFGIDWIEVGHPAVSDRIHDHATALCDEGLTARTLAHARALPDDIEAAAACNADAVGIFFSVSDEALEQRFRRNEDDAIDLIVDAIDLANDHGLTVRYTPEDTVRTPLSTVERVATAATDAGADRISIADTTGWCTPDSIQRITHRLHDALDAPLHVHCHDDLGLAVANALAATHAGARTVDVAVNGIGERCGITPLAPFIVAVDRSHGTDHGYRLDRLPRIAETVADATGIPTHPLAPITGDNAFAHNAGLHVAAVLQDPAHYESIPAERVGRTRRIALDPMSGHAAARHRLEAAGIDPTPPLVDRVLRVIKALGTSELDDDELTRLVDTIRLARDDPHPEAPLQEAPP